MTATIPRSEVVEPTGDDPASAARTADTPSDGDPPKASRRDRRREHRARRTPVSRVMRRGVLSLIVFSAGFVAWLAVLSALPGARSQEGLERRFNAELSQGVAPVNQPIPYGAPVARLEIPGLDLNQVVVEGSTARQLVAGPGHLRSSALPGQQGVSVILGRRLAYGGPFGGLDALRRNDPVRITNGQGTVRYRVSEVRVVPAADASAFSADGPALLLVSSDPPLLAADRLVVTAEPVGELQSSGARDQRGPVTARELGLAGDPAASTGLLVWSQLLVAAMAGGAFLTRRWGRWPAWVVVAPLVAATLWGVYEHLVLLLPATL